MKYHKVDKCVNCFYHHVEFNGDSSKFEDYCINPDLYKDKIPKNSKIWEGNVLLNNINIIPDFCSLPNLPEHINIKEIREKAYSEGYEKGKFDGFHSTLIANYVDEKMPYPKGPED